MVVSFKDADLEKMLTERADGNADLSAGLVAKRDLARYYWTLSQREARLSLTSDELEIACTALEGIPFVEPWIIQGIPATIEDEVAQKKLEKTNLESVTSLQDKLNHATPLQLLGLADRVERYWNKQAIAMEELMALQEAGEEALKSFGGGGS